MSSKSNRTIGRLARAVAAAAVLTAAAAAQAQDIDHAHFAAPTLTSVAASAGTPPAIAGVATAATPTARPPAVPAQPAALTPSVPTPAASPVACTASAEFSHLDRPLLRTAQRLAGGGPLTIVAIGSSSTAGAGASSPVASYPSQLAVELNQRFPGRDITVLNRGVNGDETDQMMARFETGVYPEHPQLVLWQVGTNSVLRDRPLPPHSAQLHEGIDELKTTGADVVLIDPQFSPTVIAKSETGGMVDQIAQVAKEKNVDLFRRFAIMRDWYQVQHLPFEDFISPDGLHMNDWSYACVAKLLAGSIAEAASRPIASAAARVTH